MSDHQADNKSPSGEQQQQQQNGQLNPRAPQSTAAPVATTISWTRQSSAAGSPLRRGSSRPSSPSKRPASEMEDDSIVDTIEHSGGMDLDKEASPSDHNSGVGMNSPSYESQLPSVDEQVTIVYREVMRDIQEEGQVGYLISKGWLSRVLSRSSESETYGPFDKSAMEGDIGPIDNEEIIAGISPLDSTMMDERGEPFIPIKPGLVFSEDYQALPQSAFQQIVNWYGIAPGQVPIKRFAHNTSPDAAIVQFTYEIYPPTFTIRKLRTENSTDIVQNVKDMQRLAPRLVASRAEHYVAFLKRTKDLISTPMSTKVRLWRLLGSQQSSTQSKPVLADTANNMPSPPTSREPSPQASEEPSKLLMEVSEFNALVEGSQREMIDIPDHTGNEKYNGSVNLATLGLASDQTLIIEEQLSKAGEDYVSDASRKRNGINNSKNLSISQPTSGRSSPAPSIMTRGRARGQGKPKGTVGLTNLGNTCYMNSALQCMRSVEELTTYFLSPRWKQELNTDNPLGHGGNIAKAYAGLINQIYEAPINSFAPRNFRQTLGRQAPQFSGYTQQDSQEFMSFLVDGLHEDLNRIKKKPYRENPDSDDNTVNDPAAIKALGEVFRENHRARNDSVAMDLFNGFYKNTMVCPKCEKVSITFDPFSLLTLQLPIENTFQHKFTFVPLSGPPVIVDVDIDRSATFRVLKEYVAARIPGTDPNCFMVAEAHNGKFYRLCDDKMALLEAGIAQNDVMIVYELEAPPSNYPGPAPKRKAKRSMLYINDADSDDEISAQDVEKYEQNMMVPVFHKIPNANQYSNSSRIGLWPTFITLTPEEARSEVEIRRKILARVANMTTRDFMAEFEAGSASDDTDADAIFTTEDDASSTVDVTVQARSVGSEEDTVDVSMSDASQSITNGEKHAPSTRPHSALLEPGAELPDALESFFEIRIVPAGQHIINSGWHTLDSHQSFASIKTRLPKKEEETPSIRSSTSQSPEASPPTSDAEDEIDSSAAANVIQSIEEDSQGFEISDAQSGSSGFMMTKPGSTLKRIGGRGKGRRKNSTYSKKERRMMANRRANSARMTPDVDSVADFDTNGVLIRLKEAIILDWDEDVYERLFKEVGGQDARKTAEILPDPALDAKRAKRTARKKSGVSLQDCFAETSKGEKLTEDNAWYCNRCKELRQAQKTLEIWTAPDILVIHLKRFSANRNFRDKVDILVDFPIEDLDLSEKVGMNDGKEIVYDLIAVDNHYGGLGGGHYTAFAKNFLDGKWYEYNDSNVSVRSNPESVITTAAYLLVYRRRSEHPLGPAPLQELCVEHWNPSKPSHSGSSSRADSPSSSSGNGRRALDDSSRDGLSSALEGSRSLSHAAAARVHEDGGAVGASAVSSGPRRRRGILSTSDDEEEDEGIGMDDVGSGNYNGPLPLPGGSFAKFDTAYDWNFNSFDNASSGARQDHDIDNDSNAAANGDDDDDTMRMGHQQMADGKMLEDFGDDIELPSTTSHHPSSPSLQPVHITRGVSMGMSDDDEEDVVAEVRVSTTGSDVDGAYAHGAK